MKKRAIGEVTRGGGFTKLVREVEETSDPIVITRGNESVAVVFPANDLFLRYLEVVESLSVSVEDSINRGLSRQAASLLILNAMVGDASKSMLFLGGFDINLFNGRQHEAMVEMLKDVALAVYPQHSENLPEESGSAGEQPPAPVEEGVKGGEQSSPTSKKRKKRTPS